MEVVAAAYITRGSLRSKKMAVFASTRHCRSTGQYRQKMVRISLMAQRIFLSDRRQLLAGLGAAALAPGLGLIAAAKAAQSIALEAKADILDAGPTRPHPAVWSLSGPGTDRTFRASRGDTLEVTLQNDLPVPVTLDWRGITGAPSAEPLVERTPVAAGARESYAVPLRHAGTFLCDPKLLGDGQARPARPLAMVVAENETVIVDRDEVLLIEDWRLRSDGTAIAPGIDPKDTTSLTTVNGQTSCDIQVRSNQRLRLRFINGFQRNVVALKIEGHGVWVMALDGQPAEPFQARNGALVLAPGGRVDVFVDATAPPGTSSDFVLHDGKQARPIARLVTSSEPPLRPAPLPQALPLPSNGLPAQLDLKNAVRAELMLGGLASDWVAPVRFATSSAPAFRARSGRAVVLALINRADIATVFHLHGHHFRLLDRLDDGWKPFWLDTLAVEPGQTQRVAFLAEHAGHWLIEAFATDWAAPRLVRWYSVE
jgi:FtsP/CotA-like multicopper oxidase with cupredoxin domain